MDSQISLLAISIYLLACNLVLVKYYHFFRRAMRVIIQDLQVVNP